MTKILYCSNTVPYRARLKDGASFCYYAYVLRGICPLIQQYFCPVMTMWKKHILATVIRIQKENWG